MEKELQQYYEARFDMMASKGWQDFIDDVQKVYDAYNVIENITDEKSLFYTKGRLDILKWILTTKEASEKTYEDLKNETPL